MVEFNRRGFSHTLCGPCGGKQQNTLNESRRGFRQSHHQGSFQSKIKNMLLCNWFKSLSVVNAGQSHQQVDKQLCNKRLFGC